MNNIVDQENEEWLPFQGYVISNKGRVFSQRRQKLVCENTKYETESGRPMYRKVGWMEDGKSIKRKVSQVVMELFGEINPRPDIYDVIDHIDGDIHNDSLENLRYLERWKNNMWSNKTTGCCFKDRKWQARIRTPVKRIALGYYSKKSDAQAVYFEARDRAMQICVGDLVIRTVASIENFVKTGVW